MGRGVGKRSREEKAPQYLQQLDGYEFNFREGQGRAQALSQAKAGAEAKAAGGKRA